jgi:hypothetical protein
LESASTEPLDSRTESVSERVRIGGCPWARTATLFQERSPTQTPSYSMDRRASAGKAIVLGLQFLEGENVRRVFFEPTQNVCERLLMVVENCNLHATCSVEVNRVAR